MAEEKMNTREIAHNLIDTMTDEQLQGLLMMFKADTTHNNGDVSADSVFGILSKDENTDLIPQEEGVWERATAENYRKEISEQSNEVNTERCDSGIPKVRVRPAHDEYIIGMQEYIDKLKTMDREEAKKLSKESLIKAGVLDEDGNPKENIVTGNFFGI